MTAPRLCEPFFGANIAEKLSHYSMPEPNSGCLLWLGGCDGYGYPWATFGSEYRSVHRVAWEEKNGPLPIGKHVLHRCDVRSCINADHLFVGDQVVNMADKVAKGRQSRGASHGDACRRGWARKKAA